MTWSLRQKSILFVLACSTCLVAATSTVASSRARAMVEDHWGRLLVSLADQLAASLDEVALTYHDQVARAATLPAVREACTGRGDALQLASALDAVREADRWLRGVAIVDTRGVAIGASPRTVAEASHAGAVRGALAGTLSISPLHVAPAPLGGGDVLTFAAPVDASVDGGCAVVLIVDAGAFRTRVDAFVRVGGPGSIAAVLDEHGIRMAVSGHPELDLHPTGRLPVGDVEEMVRDGRFGERTRSLLTQVVAAPEQFEIARAPALDATNKPARIRSPLYDDSLSIARRPESLPWTVFVSVPEEFAYAQVDVLVREMLLASALLTAVAIAAGVALVRRLQEPIVTLAESADRMARGETSLRIPVTSRDEVGRLAEAFNTMATHLHLEREQLEEKVRHRTSELLRAKEELQAQTEELRTNQRELEAQQLELRSKNLEIERANALKTEFLANMSHELRTPLNSVIGFSDLLLDPAIGPLTPRQTRFVEDIMASGRHLLLLINDILDLSRIEAGQLALDFREVRPGGAVHEAVTLVEPQASKRRISLRNSVEELPRVRADAGKLLQVISNLLANAVKFSPEGSEVTVGAEALGESVRFFVRDHGPGISADLRPRLFQPFVQGEDPFTKRHNGTGLGLAICRRLVSMHGGIIDVESVPGQGAEFWFTVPVADNQTWPRSAVSDVVRSTSRPRVLVVDDHDLNRELARAILEQHGYSVDVEADGAGALASVRRIRPDVILLDLAMPGMDGYAVARKLKADPTTAGIPLCALTALAMRNDRDRARAVGIDTYLTKPIDRWQLVDTVARLVAASAPRDA